MRTIKEMEPYEFSSVVSDLAMISFTTAEPDSVALRIRDSGDTEIIA